MDSVRSASPDDAASGAPPENSGDVVLAFASTPAEETVLGRWFERRDGGQRLVRARRHELEGVLAANGASDPRIVPARVAWFPADGRAGARLRDVLTFRDPRRPAPVRQSRIVAADPSRYRVLVGEAARVSELRRRFASREGETFETFVERQGLLALERAERGIIGDRYKVPRLVREDLLASARFQAMLAGLAERDGRPLEEVAEEAARALDEMVASQSRLAIDAWDHFGRFLGRAYNVDVDTARLDELRRLNASRTLVFLPSHRSYLDTLVLRPVLHRVGFPPNHVLGGANLDFWPMGPVARRNGYVFIRRSMKDARVYKAVLREYLAYLLRKRFNLEWYLEGGRSRTGKLRPPRYGILNYLVDAFRESDIEDVLLVPVSVVYDQLHEVGAMAAEEHGALKQAEGLKWIIDYARAQARPFGAAHVSFAEPLSLREALREEQVAVPKIAFEVLNRVNSVTPITATSIVALALLRGERRAITFDEGRAMLRPILAYAEARGLPMVEGVGVGKTAVATRALSTLVREGIVTEYAGGSEPVYEIAGAKHVEAAFYRNNVVHHFLTRAIVELALAHVAARPFPDAAEEVWQEALRLRDLLKFEFFFPRKRTFAEDVRTEASILAPGWERRRGDPAEVRALLAQAPVIFAPRVLGSFIEAYLLAAERLAARDPLEPVEQDAFLKECVGIGRQLVMTGHLRTPESVSRELYAGALRLAGNRGLLEGAEAPRRELRVRLAHELREVRRRIDELRTLAHPPEAAR